MQERIIEIIVYVMSGIKQNKAFSDMQVQELLNKGYSDSEISTALSWIIDRIELPETNITTDNKFEKESFRVFHASERDLFTIEALGQIIQLNTLGLLSNENVEFLIDRASTLGISKIDIAQLNFYLVNTVFNSLFSEIPSSKIMLNGSELIN